MKEHSGPTGIFSVKVIHDATGELLEEYTAENLIVGGGKAAQAALVAGAPIGKKVITIGFGTDGTPPANSDTTLTASYTKAIGSATFPDATSVLFSWTLGTSEANGMAIQEFGLLTYDSTLFARRTRAVINKTSDLRLEGTWKIQF